MFITAAHRCLLYKALRELPHAQKWGFEVERKCQKEETTVGLLTYCSEK
jgi:hypothetical protein